MMAESVPPTTEAEAEDYFAVKLATLRAGRPVDFEVFVRRDEGIAPYSEAGVMFDQTRAMGLQQHGIGEVHVREADRALFCRYVEAHLASMLADDNVGNPHKAVLITGAARNLAREIAINPVSQTVDRGRSLVVRVAGLVMPDSEKLAETVRSAASDQALYQECVTVAIYCLAFGDHLRLKSTKTLGELALAGFVANIGKSRLPAKIRMRTNDLAPREEILVRRHPEMSMEMVDRLIYPETRVGQGILLHHEHRDGSGFPKGIRGQQIPMVAQLVGLADLYDEGVRESGQEGSAAALASLQALSTQYQHAFDRAILTEFINFIGKLLA
jgi:HD-GYP domain-containing protein (c-di-GMP phosphodiesterase class II)